ncbi:MAG: hypothetical protein WA081_17075 [Desulfosalsimonadaceae bacterium]
MKKLCIEMIMDKLKSGRVAIVPDFMEQYGSAKNVMINQLAPKSRFKENLLLISKKNVTDFSDYFDCDSYFPDYLNWIRCAQSFYWVF